MDTVSNNTIENFNFNNFRTFLDTSSKEQLFELDLSNCSVEEIINQFITIRSQISPNYWKNYSSLLYYIHAIQKEFDCILYPKQINETFWKHFVPYLYHNNLAGSTIEKICGQLKTSLTWGAKYGVLLPTTYDMVRVRYSDTQPIALSLDEVSRIYWFDCNTIPKRGDCIRNFKRVKDMFVLSCNLGQRFSDMVRIDRTCFEGNLFSICQQKTGTISRVDMQKFCLDLNVTYQILEKYNYKAPICGDLTNYNRNLKDLVKYIGFDEEVKYEEIINSKSYIKYIPKWDLITSHTARRTFATINIKRGYSEIEVRKATGHKWESSFDSYVRL